MGASPGEQGAFDYVVRSRKLQGFAELFDRLDVLSLNEVDPSRHVVQLAAEVRILDARHRLGENRFRRVVLLPGHVELGGLDLDLRPLLPTLLDVVEGGDSCRIVADSFVCQSELHVNAVYQVGGTVPFEEGEILSLCFLQVLDLKRDSGELQQGVGSGRVVWMAHYQLIEILSRPFVVAPAADW